MVHTRYRAYYYRKMVYTRYRECCYRQMVHAAAGGVGYSSVLWACKRLFLLFDELMKNAMGLYYNSEISIERDPTGVDRKSHVFQSIGPVERCLESLFFEHVLRKSDFSSRPKSPCSIHFFDCKIIGLRRGQLTIQVGKMKRSLSCLHDAESKCIVLTVQRLNRERLFRCEAAMCPFECLFMFSQ